MGRHAGYVVVLEQDLHEDDSAATLSAIKQIKGVLEIHVLRADTATHIAEARARQELGSKMWEVLYGDDNRV
jgi:hypothetical protein